MAISRHHRPKSSERHLTLAQAEAFKQFARDVERSSRPDRRADKQLDARMAVAAAKTALGPRHAAAVDLIIVRGRSAGDVARAAGIRKEAVHELLHQAADLLASHYESREAADG